MSRALKIGSLTARIPVIQGGMGVGISLSGLAGEAARCGGIGVISAAQIGYREADFDTDPLAANLRALKQEITKAKEIAAGGIIGVNIMTAMRWYEEYVEAAVQAGADLIISGAGLPVQLPALVKDSLVKIAPIVSTFKSASVLCRLWERKHKTVPDLVVIEGPKAGGHLGFSKEQIEQIRDDEYDEEIRKITAYIKALGEQNGKEIPVVAAGGIYTRADMEHYLELGVQGVQIGTRFVTTYECDADIKYKQSYIDACKEDIKIMKSPVGMPGRAIRNQMLTEAEKTGIPIKKCRKCLHKCDPANIPFCITDALIHAAKGEIQDALLFCGANAYRAEKLEHVKDIMDDFA